VVDEKTVLQGIQIYGSRWVDVPKKRDGEITEKSRLVAQFSRQRGHINFITKSPGVSRPGQRIAAAIAVMFPENQSYIREISQTYLQSESTLERHVYLKPLPEIILPQSKVQMA